MSNDRSSNAFTLVELSIVMVIMGLLVAAVVSGRSLYKSAQLNAVISEIQDYKIAIRNFSAQYQSLPGDINKADNLWPDANTRNGNNNGKIDQAEYYSFWQHLELAKMISGNYSGDGAEMLIGINVPKDSHFNGGFYATWQDKPANWQDSEGRYFSANYIIFAKKQNTSEKLNSLSAAILTPSDAYSIDNKIDNENPDFGKVLAGNGSDSKDCLDGKNYNFKSDKISCILYFNFEE